MASLLNKTGLVTGASRGIGRAAAASMAKAGARLLVHYGRGRDEADSLVAEIRAAGGWAKAISADLSAPDGPHLLASKVRDGIDGRLDILVANAGISKAALIADLTVEDFDRLYAVNVRGPYFLLQQLLPTLADDASITMVSSLGARMALGNLSAYAATKGAVDTMVKHFAMALGSRGIRVNAIAPGIVDTDMSNFTKTEAGRAAALSVQFLQRIAKADDIGGVFTFLASDEARWITGTTIHVDGGAKV
jgi:3-oxoacyl-[acyl-carrier protein] reductase